jgi:hypothetical protein
VDLLSLAQLQAMLQVTQEGISRCQLVKVVAGDVVFVMEFL